MAKTNKLINRPLDRDYFKYKDRPKPKETKQLTPCCDQDLDHVVDYCLMKVNSKTLKVKRVGSIK